jgi:hypothetical protein
LVAEMSDDEGELVRRKVAKEIEEDEVYRKMRRMSHGFFERNTCALENGFRYQVTMTSLFDHQFGSPPDPKVVGAGRLFLPFPIIFSPFPKVSHCLHKSA